MDTTDEEFPGFEDTELSLLETLDHVLDRGLVIAGEVTISVADVDLIFLGLNVLLGSVETIDEVLSKRALGEGFDHPSLIKSGLGQSDAEPE
jgi:gas vesicle structural protein